MPNEDSILEEAIANLREYAQRIRATQNLMHARGMTEDMNYRELLTRLSTALAMREAALMWRLRGGAVYRRRHAGAPTGPPLPLPLEGSYLQTASKLEAAASARG